jgi:hypothetical protein
VNSQSTFSMSRYAPCGTGADILVTSRLRLFFAFETYWMAVDSCALLRHSLL